MPAAANTYRVVKVPDSLLVAMRTARDQSKTTNAHFLAAAVNVHLPDLVAELQRLGFGTRGESLTRSQTTLFRRMRDARTTQGSF